MTKNQMRLMLSLASLELDAMEKGEEGYAEYKEAFDAAKAKWASMPGYAESDYGYDWEIVDSGVVLRYGDERTEVVRMTHKDLDTMQMALLLSKKTEWLQVAP